MLEWAVYLRPNWIWSKKSVNLTSQTKPACTDHYFIQKFYSGPIMAIAFISDLHLTPEHPDSGNWFREFMEKAKGKFTQIYILGDLFEVWVGDDGAGLLGQEQIQNIIRDVADSGIEFFFIHGNRDFFSW